MTALQETELNTEAAVQSYSHEKCVPKICSKFIREQPCRSAISIKLLCSFIEITLRHGCSLSNLLLVFKIPFPKIISGVKWLNETLVLTWVA